MPTTNSPRQLSPVNRVLVVDADDDSRTLYREAFSFIGWETAEASDGLDALVKAFSPRPSVIVTELRLAFVDGFALCDVLRRDAATTDVVIVIVTAETRPAELDRARKLADAVMIKPALPETVLSEAARLIQSRSRREPSDRRAIAADAPIASRRTALSKAHTRTTTTAPPTPPPMLTCPSCDRSLNYERSHVGGVSQQHSEQWDYLTCSVCGAAFQYRQRTRKPSTASRR